METIQYSLKDNISININLALERSRKSICIEKDNNDLFDKYCLELYGKRTCILIQLDNEKYEARFLDKINKKNIDRKSFYVLIPSLVEKSYTVVIIDKINTGKEIVAIHSPSNVVT